MQTRTVCLKMRGNAMERWVISLLGALLLLCATLGLRNVTMSFQTQSALAVRSLTTAAPPPELSMP